MTGTRHGSDLSADELRDEIARTRTRLSADIEQLRSKLSPQGLEYEARSVLRGVGDATSDALTDWTRAADHQVSRLGPMTVDFVKRHPLPTTLLGLGIAWLAARSGRRRPVGAAMAPDETALTPTTVEGRAVGPVVRTDLPPRR